jgi:LmbE family N-acetylglucosaminyl deacetylase
VSVTAAASARAAPAPADAARRLDLLVLSPHLDDAALSCGGSIHRCTRAGGRALVVTLFAGDVPRAPSAFAREVEALWGLDNEVMAARRAEDERAMAILGAELRHWDLIDALYRTAPGGEPLYENLKALRAEVRDPGDLSQRLETGLRELPGAARVLAPLAVGGHVDHQLARQAAESVLGDAPELRFYEDYPYARSRFALRRALGRRRRWIAESVDLEEADVEARCAATLAYPSQLGTAFDDERDVRRQLRRYVARRGGERLWHRR